MENKMRIGRPLPKFLICGMKNSSSADSMKDSSLLDEFSPRSSASSSGTSTASTTAESAGAKKATETGAAGSKVSIQPSVDFTQSLSWNGGKNIYANQYQDTSKRFRGTLELMRLWKGSVVKLVWHDLLAFLVCYALLSVLYREVLFDNPRHREVFELVCIYASRFRYLIPITFLTGFYVSQVVSRWWDQFMTLPWPDRLALKLVSYIPGQDPFRRNLRRTVMRYVNVSIILVFRLVSHKVHARFPSMQSLIDSKLLLKTEAERLQKVDDKTPHESTWAPILWALKLIERARTQGRIAIEAPVYSNLVSSFDFVEQCNRKILNYGWVNFPLAYTQVATLSVIFYFVTSLFAAQYLIPSEESKDESTFPHLNVSFSTDEQYKHHTPDMYFPFFTVLEFISYMGWIKVAETLLNPFGDDDEDFQINYLIDRNLQVSYMIVDEADMQVEVSPDPFLEAGIEIPPELPYTSDVHRDNASIRTAGGVDENDHFLNPSSSFTASSNRRIDSIRKGVRKISNWTVGSNTPRAQRKSNPGKGVTRNRTIASVPERMRKASDLTAAKGSVGATSSPFEEIREAEEGNAGAAETSPARSADAGPGDGTDAAVNPDVLGEPGKRPAVVLNGEFQGGFTNPAFVDEETEPEDTDCKNVGESVAVAVVVEEVETEKKTPETPNVSSDSDDAKQDDKVTSVQ